MVCVDGGGREMERKEKGGGGREGRGTEREAVRTLSDLSSGVAA